jgi:hypothetical protein
MVGKGRWGFLRRLRAGLDLVQAPADHGAMDGDEEHWFI